jgi:hypothetical protein
LIATQGSAFKDSIVGAVVAHLKSLAVYVKVVDVSALPQVREADWDAIVVIQGDVQDRRRRCDFFCIGNDRCTEARRRD